MTLDAQLNYQLIIIENYTLTLSKVEMLTNPMTFVPLFMQGSQEQREPVPLYENIRIQLSMIRYPIEQYEILPQPHIQLATRRAQVDEAFAGEETEATAAEKEMLEREQLDLNVMLQFMNEMNNEANVAAQQALNSESP